MAERNWHLRFFVTPRCNFACIYCNPNRVYAKREELSTNEAKQILKAAFEAGIKKVHWTGGEPTTRRDLLELMAYAKEIGYTEQVMTTNGSILSTIIDEAIKNGLTRVNVSLDTLNKDKFNSLTGMNCYDEVIKCIRECSKKIPGYVKINVVTMAETLEELPQIIDFVDGLNRDKVFLKLICINPNNPAQLDENGEKFYENSNVSFSKIYEKLSSIDELEYLDGTSFGDNPNCEYYRLKRKNITIGIIAEPSWDYKCGGVNCRKLRITPYGEVANCIQDNLTNIKGLTLEEQIAIFVEKMAQKEYDDYHGAYRKHYRQQLGEMRFGKVANPKQVSRFERLTKK